MKTIAAVNSSRGNSIARFPLVVSRKATFHATRTLSASAAKSESNSSLTIVRPDDWHLHLRDGDFMRSVVNHTAQHYSRAIVMPNLAPPVTTTTAALAYRQRILDALAHPVAPSSTAVPSKHSFTPLMTLYLTDSTSPDEIHRAKASGAVFACKLYPAGATTNSDSGVTDIAKVLPALKAMAQVGLPLLVHGEVTDAHVDMFDREAVFIQQRLVPLLNQLPELKVVMEHITTRDAAEFVLAAPANVAATVTPQHLLLNRNALLAGGLRPHAYCLPVLKRETHRQAVLAAVASGSKKFFLGTDSAPHARGLKEAACGCAGMYSAPVSLAHYAAAFEAAGALDKLEAFASFNGPDFYGLPRNKDTVTLAKTRRNKVPDSYVYGNTVVIPMSAGQVVDWEVL
uniref:Dihydroorotase, mitochondrial n=1 Tax=Polytomella parva TaxID=51329 RepID=A0A7S0VIZ1_9CHLO